MDKSIVIIGNGASLKNSGLGKKIDEFDEVIRINECKTKGWEEDAGMKFTIWATFNPDKRIMKFIRSYISLGYSMDTIKELVKEVHEIWYVGARADCSRPWKSKFVTELELDNVIKRHSSPLTVRQISRVIEYPTTGFVLIWLFTRLYDKIYLAGFDFGGITDPTLKYHHYFHETPKYDKDIHNFKHEHEIVDILVREGKIEYLKPDTNIGKGKYIYNPVIEKQCPICNKKSYLYMWENRICHYCESIL